MAFVLISIPSHRVLIKNSCCSKTKSTDQILYMEAARNWIIWIPSPDKQTSSQTSPDFPAHPASLEPHERTLLRTEYLFGYKHTAAPQFGKPQLSQLLFEGTDSSTATTALHLGPASLPSSPFIYVELILTSICSHKHYLKYLPHTTKFDLHKFSFFLFGKNK